MSETDTPAFRYTAAMAQDIELRWQEIWAANGTFHAPNPTGELADPAHPRAHAPKLFVLDMFPFPSGAGLHVGHPLGYIATDVYSRFQRMAGFNVLHPMGFDSFGLPTEQYAVQTGTHPQITTDRNIIRYKQQLRRLGLGYDERRSFATTDPEYYRWTQWIFLKCFTSWYDPEQDKARPIDTLVEKLSAEPGWAEKSAGERRQAIDEHRLAYVSHAPVNWCPGLGTVLANEEITSEGRSERGNFPVFKRNLKQWMMRITAYGDRLLTDLEALDWPESVKTMQRTWIGKSTGAHVDFASPAGDIRVFTTRPDTLFGATYMVLAPEHELVDALVPDAWPTGVGERWTGGHATPAEAVAAYRKFAATKSDLERQTEGKDKTGVFTGAYGTNPVNGAEVPIFIADYVLAGYGTGAIMAVPAQDTRDWEFAEAFGLPIVRTVQPPADWENGPFTGDGVAINSATPEGFTGGPAVSLDGLAVAEAKARIITWLEETGRGVGATTFRLRDWLFSRQRYWGEPFPIVYDAEGFAHAVPESMLPVVLPEIDDFSPKTFEADDANSSPEPPLGRATDWITVEMDLGDGVQTYTRETNTMPNWAGSCWYEMRYLDPANAEAFVGAENEEFWMGPRSEGDPGGADLYVGGVEHAVLHLLYARFWQKVVHDLGYVSAKEPFRRLFNQGYVDAYVFRDSREFPVEASEVVERDGKYFFGDEEVRRSYGKMGKSLKNVVTPDSMCEEYGADTFRVYEMSMGPLDVNRPWETRAVVGAQRFLQRVWRLVIDEESGEIRVGDAPADDETRRLLHKTIDGVRGDTTELRFNTAIAKLIGLTNHVTGLAVPPREVVEPLVLMVSPFAPHLAEELWTRLGHDGGLSYVDFPVADPAQLVADTVTYPVQVNGKVRGRIEVAADLPEAEVQAAALAEIASSLDGRTPKKVIVVKGRMVSVVV
ncbi:leucine--tRNA ligase [Longispora fulva]|uniref:Leucine--tRNA ligase n=1 Tax=Longispora fulva TaxID=619741 RepID=A0A8J7H4B1_9ACTN|nr:leucine--tRNA ligase [Longispora fulva]MBG6141178.1 leucyl-tRNA synthetase [Longispora fulva]GIG62826.1 leucine--tRNA ligase [Longispora fulva]